MPNSNYTNLTAHVISNEAIKSSTNSRRFRPRNTPAHLVPKIGQVFVLDHTHIIQDDRSRTPAVKINVDENGEWQLVSRGRAGMWVFLNEEPTHLHTKFVISRIIPSQTAAYADLQ